MDLRRESQIGILLDVQAETFRRGLQEVSIARRALRVQLEIFHAAVVQDDDLDVLPAHIDDDVRIFVKLQRRLGVRHGLHQRHVGMQNIFQNVFRIAGRGDAQHFQLGALRFHLPAQVLEHLNRVLNRIAVRELIGLAEDVAVFIQQHRLGRSRAAIDADKAADRLPFWNAAGVNFFRRYASLKTSSSSGFSDQALAAGLRLFLLPSELDVVNQLVVAADSSRRSRLRCLPNSIAPSAAKYCAFCGTLIRSSGFAPSGIATLRSFHMRGMFACHASRMPANKTVRPAQQQHVRPQRVAARQHAQVLQHDRFEQRSHQLVRTACRLSADR